jgi:hypothetical protein
MPARPAVNLAAIVMTPVVTLLGGGLCSVLVAPRLGRALELIGFIVVFTCMILMRFGL